MKTMLAILFLIFTTMAGLFYLYSENGPVKKWEQEEVQAYKKAMESKK